jgi:hypothetical protein
MPAVVVTGARQTGKSTLAEQLVPRARRYATTLMTWTFSMPPDAIQRCLSVVPVR